MIEVPIRKIIHIDMDAFFAAVEQRDNPELRGKPVIVGGRPNGRGVVATCSYEARPFGIRSAMPAAQAKRLCPHAVFVRPNFKRYKEASNQIRKIFSEVTDLIEPLSLDEAYLDVTQNKLPFKTAAKTAAYLKARIKGQTGLTASAGVGPCKFIAKLGSDFDKPDGLVVVPPEKVLEFIAPMSIDKLWGVGKETAKKLRALGYEKICDLRSVDRPSLIAKLGKHGGFFWDLAHGIDTRSVQPHRERKSCGSERTFHQDLSDVEAMEQILAELSDEVAEALQKNDRGGRTITVKVRYKNFETVTRSQTFASRVRTAGEILAAALPLMHRAEVANRDVRLLGVSVSNFNQEISKKTGQLSFEI